MASYTFSSMGSVSTFDPSVDTINFGTTSPTSMFVNNNMATPGVVDITANGVTKSIDMSAAAGVDLNNSILSLKTSAFVFSSGIFQIGDGLVSSAGDNGNLTVTGTAGNDRLQVFGGNDAVNGGAGNDLIVLSLGTVAVPDPMNPTNMVFMPTNDVVDGGDGFDNLMFNIAPGGGVNVFMAGGSANWFSNGQNAVVMLNNFETVTGTSGNDFMSGGLASFEWVDADWVSPGVSYVDVQTFRGSGGWDTLGGDGIADGLRQVADYSSLTGSIQMQFYGGDSNPWRSVMKPGANGSENDQLYDIARVIGTGSADWLTGGSNHRSQFGGLFEEFQGNAGNDTIEGFGGYDQVFYTNAPQGVADAVRGGYAGVTVDLDAGTATDGFGGTDTLMEIEGVIASNYNDTLYGSDVGNFFLMRGGNDMVDGRGGFDLVSYQGSTTAVNASLAIVGAQTTGKQYVFNSTVPGGTDTLTDIEGLRGTDFNDTLTGGGVTANRGLTGNRREEFEGRAGNDIIDGGDDHAANLAVYGDESIGFDYASYSRAPELVTIDLSRTITDGSGTYVLAEDGYGTQDRLYNINGLIGTRFDDVLIGDAGINSFMGNGGNDVIDGGDGIDSVRYDQALEGVYVDLDAGVAYDGMGYWTSGPLQFGGGMNAGFSVDGGMDVLTNIEYVIGSKYEDRFFGNAANNKFWGGAGFDMFDSRDAGADTLLGGADDDFYFVKPGDVVVEFAGEGSDTVISFGNFTITAGNEIETLILRGGVAATGAGRAGKGNELNNNIVGTEFNDSLFGLAGNDKLVGGKGNDVMDGGTGNDGVSFAKATSGVSVTLDSVLQQDTGEGLDTIKNVENLEGSAFADVLTGKNVSTTSVTSNNMISGGGGNDMIFGLGGNDTLDGGIGSDQIDGGAGNDVLIGGRGNDLLIGGVGVDTMSGGLGADVFSFVTTADGGGTAGYDLIQDFVVGQDKIQVLADNFTGLVAGQPVTVVLRAANNNALGTGPQFILNQSNGFLRFDPDGTTTSASYAVAQMTGITSLSSSDFIVVGGP